MRTIAIIGGGRVGRTLGRLWAAGNVFGIGTVSCRTEERARAAAAFIGAGEPVWRLQDVAPADVTLIATADDAIAPVCAELARLGRFGAGGIVFHCSGASPSALLAPARACGSAIASLHPVKSFADPATAVESFAGTYCAIEGDGEATPVLTAAAEAIGGLPFTVSTEQKLVYHAASVFVCNYLPPLIEIGLDCHRRAGVERELALRIIRPLVEETVRNIFEAGTARALTGPVARGDADLVAHQLEAVQDWRPDYGEIYRGLALAATDLARAAGQGDRAGIDEIEARLRPERSRGS